MSVLTTSRQAVPPRSENLHDRATEGERLTLQARVWELAAEEMIRAIGVHEGWRCADLGCGAMGILRPLSFAAGEYGRIEGIDNDPAMVEMARRFFAREHLSGVSVQQGDAFESELPRGAYDLVHARFLLAQTGREAELVKEMVALARPDGVVAVQEADSASWNCYPRRAGWDALKPAILRAFRINGGDFDAGTRLFGLLRRAGLEDVQVRSHVVALPPGHPYRRLPVQFATLLRQRIVERGLLTEQQLAAAVNDCELAAADEGTMFNSFTLTQAWGRKPA